MSKPKDSNSDEPLLPGTEQARSLGDLMREAAASNQKPDGSPALTDAGRAAKIKKTSRTRQRRYAREKALQALYQWDIGNAQSSDVREQFLQTQDMSRVDVDYFTALFNGISHDPDAVDEAMINALDRPLTDLDPIERAVLRIAVYELQHRLDVPVRVVINEGIEITKRFGADKGHHYVNGVLDKLAAVLRPQEGKSP